MGVFLLELSPGVLALVLGQRGLGAAAQQAVVLVHGVERGVARHTQQRHVAHADCDAARHLRPALVVPATQATHQIMPRQRVEIETVGSSRISPVQLVEVGHIVVSIDLLFVDDATRHRLFRHRSLIYLLLHSSLHK